MRATWLLLPSLALCAACLKQTEFKCATNDQCGPSGTCETIGYCSLPDSECGRRYSDTAGPYAGKCVDDGPGPGAEAGIDGPPTDTPPAMCPTDYTALQGGNPSHLYRRAPTSTIWTGQDDYCRSTSTRAYLAVPDDAAELSALRGAANATTFWVGINDRVAEGTYVRASGGTFPVISPLWATDEPDDPGNGQDCVAGTSTTLSTEDCEGNNASRAAVCECVP